MIDPDDLFDHVVAAIDRGDQSGAIASAEMALRAGVDEPLVLMLVAEGRERDGDFAGARALLEQAITDASGEPELWSRYGVLLGRIGRHGDARAALERAAVLAPTSGAVLIALATACFVLGDLDVATERYEAAARMLPQAAEPLAALAAIAARRRDPARARGLATRALALQSGNVAAQLALARADLIDGNAAQAETRASALLDRVGRSSEAAVGALDLRADARDALGRWHDAFDDYVARNALLKRQYAPLIAGEAAESRIDEARRLHRRFAAASPGDWLSPAPLPAEPGAPAAMLFVVGFPRSGTTLLEKALDGHSAIVSLPEIDCFGEAGAALLADEAGLVRLATLDAAAAGAYRRRYLAAAARAAGGSIAGKVLVDKMPLHTLMLPLIAKLFPDAGIVLSLRDPRDVVLSGMRRRFQMNAAMFELLELGTAAAYYDAVMALAERYRALLPLAVHEVRHEALVGDFEGEVRRVLALVGLGWEETIRDFPNRARARARTPSDYQLVRGLNAEGIGHWRNYAALLEPVLPVLEPWARRFGYQS